MIFLYPVVIKHGWLENPLGIEVLKGKSLINGSLSIAMFDYRRVDTYLHGIVNQLTTDQDLFLLVDGLDVLAR